MGPGVPTDRGGVVSPQGEPRIHLRESAGGRKKSPSEWLRVMRVRVPGCALGGPRAAPSVFPALCGNTLGFHFRVRHRKSGSAPPWLAGSKPFLKSPVVTGLKWGAPLTVRSPFLVSLPFPLVPLCLHQHLGPVKTSKSSPSNHLTLTPPHHTTQASQSSALLPQPKTRSQLPGPCLLERAFRA